jgi:hypothetical protein
MCQKGTDLLSVVLLNRTGRERSSPAAALHTFQHQQLILIDSSPSSSPATVLSIFLFIPFFCFIFDPKSSGSISLFVNIELFCIFQTRKKKKRKSFLPPLCIDLPLVYKSQMRVYLLFPDMCQRHFCRRYIISCVCVADRAIRPGRFLYFSRPTE